MTQNTPPKIAIIGAGITGLMTAYYLTKAGLNATVLERETIGGSGNGQASANSLGALIPYPFTKQGDFHNLQRQSLRQWVDIIEEIGAADAYFPTGRLQLFNTQKQAEHGTATVAASGGAQHLVSAVEINEKYPKISNTYGGMHCNLSAYIHPQNVLKKLAAKVRQNGGRITENWRQNSGNEAEIWQQLNDFDLTIICNGVWANELLQTHPEKSVKQYTLAHITPIKGQALRVKLPNPAPNIILRNQSTYIIPDTSDLSAQNIVHIGSSSEDMGFDLSCDEATARELIEKAATMLPMVKEGKILNHWAGLRPRRPSDAPLIQRLNQKTIFATGHHKIGLCLAPLVAGLVLAEIHKISRDKAQNI